MRLTVGMALASYVFNAELARGYLLIVLVLTTALSLLGRFVLRRRLHRARARGRCMHRVLVLGHAHTVAQMTRQLHRRYHHGLQVIGACLPADQLAEAASTVEVPVFGALGAAANSAAAAGADTVMVLSCPELDGPMLRRLAWELERDDIDLIVSSSLVDTAGDRITVRPVDGLPMMHVEHPRLIGGRRLIKSRVRRLAGGVAAGAARPAVPGDRAGGSSWTPAGRCSSARSGWAAAARCSGCTSSGPCTWTRSSACRRCGRRTSPPGCSSRSGRIRG